MTEYELIGMFTCGCRWQGAELWPCSRHSRGELANLVMVHGSPDAQAALMDDANVARETSADDASSPRRGAP